MRTCEQLCMYSYTHSFICLLTHAVTHLCSYSLMQLLTYSLTQLLSYSVTHLLTCALTHLCSYSLMQLHVSKWVTTQINSCTNTAIYKGFRGLPRRGSRLKTNVLPTKSTALILPPNWKTLGSRTFFSDTRPKGRARCVFVLQKPFCATKRLAPGVASAAVRLQSRHLILYEKPSQWIDPRKRLHTPRNGTPSTSASPTAVTSSGWSNSSNAPAPAQKRSTSEHTS